MGHAVIVAAVRTPIGKFLGTLSGLSAVELATHAVREVLRRTSIDPAAIDEVIFGQVIQAGQGQNPARQVALRSGLPPTVSAFTVNKVCGSGLKAVMLAAQAIRAGDAKLVLAGGMESMSQAPFLLLGARQNWRYGHQQAHDALLRDGLCCAFENWHMGEAAEYIASRYSISRAEQDAYALESHRRATQAWQQGWFREEIAPVTYNHQGQSRTVERDEGFRPDTTLEALANLPPAFCAGGTVTAGNASMLSDGAAALLVADSHTAERLGLRPLARIIAYTTSGVAPKDLFIAPVSAIRAVCDQARLGLPQVDLIELNEAFAAQMLACLRELGLPREQVNVQGGAIALGHPIGASGARVLTTLIYALQRRHLRTGIAALCLGGGNAVAMLIEAIY
ncbi:MAG: thiolase family protein [Gemmatales bacterium]|nr:thiolase family protein [Gemmatales bacterium]MDW7993617.1 thiolase family protein [Gemmatales bacterium]